MKTIIYTTAFLILAGARAATASDQTPFFEARFNEDEVGIEMINGAELGDEGSGVSGTADDRAYIVATDTVLIAPETGPAARIEYIDVEEELNEITITLWYKLSQKPNTPMNVVNLAGLNLILDESNQFTLRVEAPRTVEFANWLRAGNQGPYYFWDALDQWIFFAATFNAAERHGIVYQGGPEDPVTLVSEFSDMPVDGPVKTAPPQGLFAAIGNRHPDAAGNQADRPIAGSVDNVRIFRTVLDESEIEAIREADLKNQPLSGQ